MNTNSNNKLISVLTMVGKKKKIKYYGVRKGHIPGIYNDWLEAQEVQSFTNKKEAQSYMKSMNKSTNTKSTFV